MRLTLSSKPLGAPKPYKVLHPGSRCLSHSRRQVSVPWLEGCSKQLEYAAAETMWGCIPKDPYEPLLACLRGLPAIALERHEHVAQNNSMAAAMLSHYDCIMDYALKPVTQSQLRLAEEAGGNALDACTAQWCMGT